MIVVISFSDGRQIQISNLPDDLGGIVKQWEGKDGSVNLLFSSNKLVTFLNGSVSIEDYQETPQEPETPAADETPTVEEIEIPPPPSLPEAGSDAEQESSEWEPSPDSEEQNAASPKRRKK